MRIAITRPEPGASATAAALTARGHAVLVAPLSQCVPTGWHLAAPLPEAIALTSAAAVRALNPASRVALADVPLFAVGAASAEAAGKAGFARIETGPGEAAGLARVILSAYAPGTRILYLAGEPRKPLLETTLRAGGLTVDTAVCYRMEQPEALPAALKQALERRELDAILHFSRETARTFTRLTHDIAEAAMLPAHFCLSRDVAEGLSGLSAARIVIAPQPNSDAMLDLCARDH